MLDLPFCSSCCQFQLPLAFGAHSWTMAQRVKASACNEGDPSSVPGSGRFPGEGNGNPLQDSCLEFHGWKNLVGYSPWGCKESDTTERLYFYFHLPTVQQAGCSPGINTTNLPTSPPPHLPNTVAAPNQ